MTGGADNSPSSHTAGNNNSAAGPYDRAGGRRFLLVLLAFMTYTALLVGDYLDSGAYVALQIATVAAYIAGNGAQKYVETRYGNGNSS
jgi:hypothetical protein